MIANNWLHTRILLFKVHVFLLICHVFLRYFLNSQIYFTPQNVPKLQFNNPAPKIQSPNCARNLLYQPQFDINMPILD